MTGDEHRAAVGGPDPQQLSDLQDTLRIQAVDRLIEDKLRRVAQHRRRKPEPLTHSEGIVTHTAISRGSAPDELQQGIDAPGVQSG